MLKAGKHVVCEKPMGMSAAQTKSVIEVAKQSGKLFVEVRVVKLYYIR